MEGDLQRAISLIKSGQKKQGGKILVELVKQQPKNESAWLWLSDCVNDNKQKIFCLNRALEINPNNNEVRKVIQKLRSEEQDIQFIDNPPVEFEKLNCPYCNGELRVPNNRHNIKCMYCGEEIIIQGSKLVALKTKNSVDHLLSLAVVAEEAKNYNEAYKYYSQVLEQDAGVSIAWIGKGISAGWLSSVQNQRLDEAVTCIAKGINSNSDAKLIERVAINLIRMTQSYTKVVCEYLDEVYNLEISPNSGGVLLDPLMAGAIIGARRPTAEKKVNNEFWQIHRVVIMRASNYAWRIFPSIEVATGIYKVIDIVNANQSLGSGVQSGFEEGFNKTKIDIKDKLPHWKPPKRKKGCFIATATMGDYNHPYVVTLRNFRDKYLLSNHAGKLIVQIYYYFSPPLAQIIETRTFLKKLSLYLIILPSILFVNIFIKERY